MRGFVRRSVRRGDQVEKVSKRTFPPLPTRPRLVLAVYPALFLAFVLRLSAAVRSSVRRILVLLREVSFTYCISFFSLHLLVSCDALYQFVLRQTYRELSSKVQNIKRKQRSDLPSVARRMR